MRPILTCVVLLVLVSFTASSQERKFKGGILAGPVFSQISGDGLGGWDKLGFAAGPWIQIPVSDKAGVTIAMKYITKGSKTKRDTLNFESFGFYLNYIDVPILLSRRFSLKKANFSWSLGPYAGVLLSQKVKSNGISYDVPQASAGEDFRAYDIGVQAGFAWWVGRRLFFELSTSTSLIPTRPAPLVVNKGSYYEKGNYNQTLQLMMAIQFGGTEIR